MNKRQALEKMLSQYQYDGICLAFSGGVDSALLLKLCSRLQLPVLAVTFQTALHPQCDLENAEQVAKSCFANWKVITVDEFSIPQLQNNPPDRCYHCKHYLFSKLAESAKEAGFHVLMDGTNADDRKEYRPGLRALREQNVISPLAECGFSKTEVRTLAAELGLAVASRPSTPCLATRLPYGSQISRELLHTIETGETFLRSCGFSALRLRVHPEEAGLIARLEVPVSELPQALEKREEICKALTSLGFSFLTLDLAGLRSGSYDQARHLKEAKL